MRVAACLPSYVVQGSVTSSCIEYLSAPIPILARPHIVMIALPDPTHCQESVDMILKIRCKLQLTALHITSHLLLTPISWCLCAHLCSYPTSHSPCCTWLLDFQLFKYYQFKSLSYLHAADILLGSRWCWYWWTMLSASTQASYDFVQELICSRLANSPLLRRWRPYGNVSFDVSQSRSWI